MAQSNLVSPIDAATAADSRAFWFGVGISIVAAIVIAICMIWSRSAANKLSDLVKADADARIAESHTRIKELDLRIEELKSENRQLAHDKTALENLILPRLLETNRSAESLRHIKGIKVILIAINDDEAINTKNQIGEIIAGAKWEPISENPDPKYPITQGIVIEHNVGIPTAGDYNAEAAHALLDALTKHNRVSARTMPAGFPELPANTLRVKIGKRPQSYLFERLLPAEERKRFERDAQAVKEAQEHTRAIMQQAFEIRKAIPPGELNRLRSRPHK